MIHYKLLLHVNMVGQLKQDEVGVSVVIPVTAHMNEH